MKFKQKMLCLLLVFVLLLSVSAVAAEGNATQSSFKEVSPDPVSVSVESNSEILGISNSEESLGATDNNEILCATDDGTFKALQDKIDNADGVLVLENDYANTDNFNKNGITISKSLTIDGNGYTIDALENGRIFQVTASNVILKNINFINGDIGTYGGAVYWNGDNGVLVNCSFVNCSAESFGSSYASSYNAYGGAVYWSGSRGVLGNCSFVNCSAYIKHNPGYLTDGGGAVYWAGDYGVLSNCSFVNCSATTYHNSFGGAVYWSGSRGVLSNCSFVDCSVSSNVDTYGGAVYWTGSSGVLGNCSFVNCSASPSTNSGAVYWAGVNGTLGNSSFVNCSASYAGAVYWAGDYGVLGNCSFVNCSAIESFYARGGAVYWAGSSGVLGNCSFVNCSAYIKYDYGYFVDSGGAVYWAGDYGVLGNCSFVNCSARADGGAVFWLGNDGVLGNCSFVNCSARGGYYSLGGAVYWAGSSGVLGNCSFVNCFASINYTDGRADGGAVYWDGVNGTLGNCSFVNCSSGTHGGAVYWIGSSGVLGNCSFVNCSSANDGGAVYWNGVNGANGVLGNCSFENCSSGTHGGAVYFYCSNNCVLGNSSFENCSARQDGGAVYFYYSNNCVLDNCSFKNCSSSNRGGAVYFYYSNNCVLGNSSFENCSSANDGGAVYWFGSSGVLGNCSFVNCSSSTFGGAVYWVGSSGVLGNCSFVDCSAGSGGAVFWARDYGVLYNCSFVDCSAGSGGAVYWNGANGANGVLGNCSFENCSARQDGGAVYWQQTSGVLGNCSFKNCSSSNRGGAVYFYYSNNRVLGNSSFVNCSFVDCSAGSGGAVYFFYSNNCVLDNCSFKNCSSSNRGGAVYFYYSNNCVLGNSSFENCSAAYGGAFHCEYSNNCVLGNCSFVDCSALSGGAVGWSGSGVLGNCSFVNCSAREEAGAVYWQRTSDILGNSSLVNCSFVGCSAVLGGAIRMSYANGILGNCSFVGCSAGQGGAVYWHRNSVVVLGNSSFVNNSAGYGGAVYWGGGFWIDRPGGNGVLDNCIFVNNSARYSGAIYVSHRNFTVNNSNFTNNYAIHGGGAIGNHGENNNGVYKVEVVITNSKFNNNHANNYGGALSLELVSVDNSTFDNNSAVFGGAIYSISPTIKNSKFKNNKALELGNSIFAINRTTIENSNINNNDIYENNLTESIIFNHRGGMPYKITYEGKTYDAFAVESNLIAPGYYNPNVNVYMVDSSFKLVRNVADSSDVSEYVKSLLYKYFKGELTYDDVSSKINDAVYDNSGISINEKAPEVEYIGNNMVNVYEYISLITPSSNTNFVFLKQSTQTLNYTVTKEALDKTAFVGDIVKFRINVTNGNNFTLPDVFFKDVFNDDEFEYLSFESNDNWTYNVNSKVFTLKSLSPLNSSSIILSFKVKTNGTLTNIVVNGIGKNETGNNNTNITVFNPQLAVEKLCLTPTVILGQTARFEIIVKNNGDIDLHDDVVITENPSQGLVFDSYDESVLWKHSVVNNKHVWTLVNSLTPGSSASFFVNFNTTALGHLANYVDIESKETNKSTTGAAVDVIKAEFKAEKIVLTPKVALGEQVSYEIVVHNTGEADLTNIVLEEMPDASLIFDRYVDSGLFKHSVVSGKHIWTLDKLAKGGYAGFILYFNTTAVGNFSNKISVKSDEVPENITTSDNTTVLLPSFSVEKISLTPTVVLGQAATFEIVIRNTGKVVLTNVYFTEDSFDGLVYDSAIGEGIWTHKFENGKHTWALNDVLDPDEFIGLILKFNTTDAGKFTNFVSAGSNQTEILTANATVNVLKPEYKVEKIVLTPKVALGEQVSYEIVVHNTGEADLTNIVVEEMPDASLVFDHYVDSGLFKHSVVSGKHIWTLDKLAKGTYAGFILYFNTTAVGNISNRISVKSDEIPENTTTSDNTTVLLPSFSVEKICLVPDVLVGNQTSFEIVIRNIGKIELTNVYFTEDSFDGLIYDGAFGEGIWTHKFENGKHTWTLNEALEPNEFIGLILRFNTTAVGNYTNFVSAGSDQTGILIANATVHVFEDKIPDPPEQNSSNDYKMDVFKIVITQEAVLGGQITFQIVVHNTGNKNLDNVKVSEILPDGLIYDNFVDYLDLWTYNNDLTWSATRAIVPGEYVGFFVTFNTTKPGKFENYIVVSADKANATGGNSSFEILNPDFTIEKILVEDNILNGVQAVFEIVVHNTGNAPLTNLTVREYYFEGLVYDHFTDYLDLWTYNGDLSWTMTSKLLPGEYAGLFVIFNTTAAGNFTNFVSGGSNETDILIANATVQVFDDKEPSPEQNSSNDYKMDVFKTVITQEAVLGGQITFQIVVHNTGNKNLDNVKVSEILPEGLIYDNFVDYLGIWTYNNDLTWTANMPIVPGEYVGFFVTFNTTKAGKFENYVVVSADKANATGGNSSFEILNPDFTIEKILVEDNILNGVQAVFEIVVHNTGNAPLTNLTVREYYFEGLVYDHFTDYLDLWTYNGDLSWTMTSKLLPGEYVGFFVTFNTTKDGVFTNIVVANSTECGDRLSNASVSVHNETIDISMICLTPLAVLGNQVTFEITIQNTGNIPITALKISEYDFEGLVYDHYIDNLGHWINDGITWTLNTTLVPREVTYLFVVFNTTKTGNFTNVILANNDVVVSDGILSANNLEDGIFVSADVEVAKTEYTIEKVALNKTANVGDEVIFEIIVHNTGTVDVSNITVRDIPSDALDYLRFVDSENYWSKNGDLSWDLAKVLVPGQYSSFFVVFNATKAGILENSLESDNLTSKSSVEVKDPVKPTNPSLIIEVEVTTDLITGKPVIKVTVINNGDVDLNNVFVKPNLPEGLEYGDYYSYDSIWNFNNGIFDLEGILKAGESKSLYIEITGVPGEYQIRIDAGYNGTIADSASVSVKVLDNSTPGNVTPAVPKGKAGQLKSSVAIGNNATGNPLLMILLVLFALGLTRFRKKD